jgi:segregation and condensation protein B
MSDSNMTQSHRLKHIIEAALLAADEPLSVSHIASLFDEDEAPSAAQIGEALEAIAADCEDRGVELREVASGFRLQVKAEFQPWISRLWTERPARYSRAMLETLALIAYRQPITRGEIESVRGVSLSPNIIRTLQEREWVRIVGHRDVPGKPALFGTTKTFLDYFNLKSLDELPTLSELRDLDAIEPELALDGGDGYGEDGEPLSAATADEAPHEEDAETTEPAPVDPAGEEPDHDVADEAAEEPPEDAEDEEDEEDADGSASGADEDDAARGTPPA